MNGPDLAFPQASGVGNMEDWKHGMTLRDYFAAAALPEVFKVWNNAKQKYPIENIAIWAYEIADAMLAERAKETGK